MSMLELQSWLRDFLSCCLHRLKIPKSWKRRLVVAIPKLIKPIRPQRVIDWYLCCASPTRSSRGLSTPSRTNYKSMLPREQARFWRGKSTVDQVILMTKDIENFFVDWSIWRRHMTLSGAVASHTSCSRLLPDKPTIRVIMELVQNRSFLPLLPVSASKTRLAPWKNAFFSARYWLSSFSTSLFLRVHLPSRISRKFTYANYLALLHFSVALCGNFKSRHDYTFSVSSTWKLKLRTVRAVFYLNNKRN